MDEQRDRKALLWRVLKDSALALSLTLAAAGLGYILWRTCPIREG